MSIDNVLKTKSNNNDILNPKKSILDEKGQQLEPESKRKFDVYSDLTMKSQHNIGEFPEDKFTNYLDKQTEREFQDNIYDYAKDWNNLDKGTLDDDFNSNERLYRIFGLYLKDGWKFDNISKCRIRTEQLDKSTSLRIYIMLEDNVYKVFLVDPLHLVLPSVVQRKNRTFEMNKGNGLCMSKTFEKINDMI